VFGGIFPLAPVDRTLLLQTKDASHRWHSTRVCSYRTTGYTALNFVIFITCWRCRVRILCTWPEVSALLWA